MKKGKSKKASAKILILVEKKVTSRLLKNVTTIKKAPRPFKNNHFQSQKSPFKSRRKNLDLDLDLKTSL